MSITKLEKGKKRVCENCSTKWYDFNKKPIICPTCNEELLYDELNRSNQIFAQSSMHDKKKPEDNINTLKISEEDINKDEVDDNQESDLISLDEIEEEGQN